MSLAHSSFLNIVCTSFTAESFHLCPIPMPPWSSTLTLLLLRNICASFTAANSAIPFRHMLDAHSSLLRLIWTAISMAFASVLRHRDLDQWRRISFSFQSSRCLFLAFGGRLCFSQLASQTGNLLPHLLWLWCHPCLWKARSKLFSSIQCALWQLICPWHSTELTKMCRHVCRRKPKGACLWYNTLHLTTHKLHSYLIETHNIFFFCSPPEGGTSSCQS